MFEGMEVDTGRYLAYVPENSPIGTSVRKVRVIDKDSDPEFKQVRQAFLSLLRIFFCLSKK